MRSILMRVQRPCTVTEIAAYVCLTVQQISQLVVSSHDDRTASALIYLVSMTAYTAAPRADCIGLYTASRCAHSRARARCAVTTTVQFAQRPLLATCIISLLQLLLRSQLVGVPTLLLPAVGSTRWQPSVALPANHLVAIVGRGKRFEGRFDDAASET